MTSPLGRYGRPDASPLHEVRLLGVPVRVLADSRERHDELLREFSLLALTDAPVRADVPARLVELTEILGVEYGGASERPDALVDDALARGELTVDLVYQVPERVIEDVARVEQLMDEADAFCASEKLLTLARTDLQRAFGNWYFEEFRRQLGGLPAQRWNGPLDVGQHPR